MATVEAKLKTPSSKFKIRSNCQVPALGCVVRVATWVLEIRHSSFVIVVPLVMGSMGRESWSFS
jgi:hypothetical protein